jgi:hypothetical protein
MTDLSTIADWLRERYNSSMSVYEWTDDGFVRLTNGSAAYFIDIRIEDGELQLEGERYGEEIDASCEISKEALNDTLGGLV